MEEVHVGTISPCKGSIHPSICSGIPSYQSRAAMAVESFIGTGLSQLAGRRLFRSVFLFHLQGNINLMTLTSSVGLDVDDFTLCTVRSSFI